MLYTQSVSKDELEYFLRKHKRIIDIFENSSDHTLCLIGDGVVIDGKLINGSYGIFMALSNDMPIAVGLGVLTKDPRYWVIGDSRLPCWRRRETRDRGLFAVKIVKYLTSIGKL